MHDLRQELQRLIDLNNAEQWVPAHIAIRQLERFGISLIPNLIACLNDEDPEVRVLAIDLLDAAGKRSGIAVPALIQSLRDPDRLVRMAAALSLRRFRSRALAAVPCLEDWLDDDDEYVRMVAVTTILRLDPTKRPSLLPLVEAALVSDHPMVRYEAESYLAEEEMRSAIGVR